MKATKKNRNFLSLLVKNYVVFTLSLLAVLIIIYLIFTMRMNHILEGPNVSGLVDSWNQPSVTAYDELDVKGFLGNKGYIVVVDDNNNIVYKSDLDSKENRYTPGELACIPDYSKNIYVTTQEYYTKDHKKLVAVSVNGTEMKSNTPSDLMLVLEGDTGQSITSHQKGKSSDNALYLLDENLKILHTTNPSARSAFTENEFKYLTGTFSDDYDIQKYKSQNQDRKGDTLLIYTKKMDEGFIGHKIFKEFLRFVLILLVSYMILIAAFIIWMNKKVKNPLVLLNEAIVNFSAESRENPLKYEGSKEFVEICNSFNQLSAQLFESEEKRKNLEKNRQKMLADISHDLRTPITVIQGYSKAICDGLVSENEKKQYLAVICQKSDGLVELIDTFYEYSIVEHPNSVLQFEVQDICEFVREYLAEKYNEICLAGFLLELEIPEELIICKFDKGQLRRVFENLIGNALKHNAEGTQLTIAIWAEVDCIKITVEDNGKGISEALFQRVFEPFQVGDASRSKKYGSGLGLAICKKIIELHGGNILLVPKSETTIGTRFEITLPKLG
ncbi:MAG: HAMP domain-containing sensor histidine kinase [Anaerovorax sp.]